MNKKIFLFLLLSTVCIQVASASTEFDYTFNQIHKDSSRIAELDRYWARLNKTVMKGDFEGYKNCFHKEAVIVFASGEYKTSVSIASALEFWREGFKNTKEGKIKVNVDFRFSQRIGNENTAHETGIFTYTSTDNATNTSETFIIPFEMLLVKRNNKWYGMMEYQKPYATQEEWDALKE